MRIKKDWCECSIPKADRFSCTCERCGSYIPSSLEHIKQREAFIEALEAKLKIAVEALRRINHECEISVTPDRIIWEFATDALEKLKGDL